jgi:rhamnosyltransferase
MEPNPSDTSMPASPLRAELQKVKICAVMVTYNPDSPLEQSVRALLTEVDRLIIIDNGSEPPIRAHIEAIACACQVEVIWNTENLGLATALNMGIRSALGSDDYAWIATFDQDSRVSPGYRDTMLNAYLSCPYRDMVGIIGPRHVLFPGDAAADQLGGVSNSLFCEKSWVMQSGTFLSAEILRKIGLFDDSFFIDYVDIDFCLRLRKRGLKIIEATRAVIDHRLGDPSRHTILGKTTTVYSHSALRRYYAARNRLRMYRRYLISDARYIGHDAWSWFKEVVKLLLFEEDRMRKLGYIARGVWDALRGRSGKYAKTLR